MSRRPLAVQKPGSGQHVRARAHAGNTSCTPCTSVAVALIEAMSAAGKPVGAVCHGVAVLHHPKRPDGTALVSGRKVTGFSNSEEAAIGLIEVVPYLVEDVLKANGALYLRADDWGSCVAVDGNLVTGQNLASSVGVAHQMLQLAAS